MISSKIKIKNKNLFDLYKYDVRSYSVAVQCTLQKNLVNMKADYAKVPNKWNIHLISLYSADSSLSSIADKRPIFDLP